jgi:hypothetical protein
MNSNDEEALGLLNRLLEGLHQAGFENFGSHINLVYVAPGAQHVDHQYNYQTLPQQKTHPDPPCVGRENLKGRGKGSMKSFKEDVAEGIRHCITLLMQEKCGNEPLFNQQNHWQALYRILVDKGYCRDSDFDGFDAFIRTVMPEEVNKPYSKGSLKQISQTDFVRPFSEWRYDVLTSKTRKPYDRMVAVARKFLEILEENGL